MIRMIASDLDGTLLRKDWSISEYTIKIIKEAQASGIRWVTVTGRSDRGARPIMENYGLSCDYILMNGAEFRDTNGNLIKSENIDTDLARFVCEKLHRENLGFEINTDRGDYTTTMEYHRRKPIFYEYYVFLQIISRIHPPNNPNTLLIPS